MDSLKYYDAFHEALELYNDEETEECVEACNAILEVGVDRCLRVRTLILASAATANW